MFSEARSKKSDIFLKSLGLRAVLIILFFTCGCNNGGVPDIYINSSDSFQKRASTPYSARPVENNPYYVKPGRQAPSYPLSQGGSRSYDNYYGAPHQYYPYYYDSDQYYVAPHDYYNIEPPQTIFQNPNRSITNNPTNF